MSLAPLYLLVPEVPMKSRRIFFGALITLVSAAVLAAIAYPSLLLRLELVGLNAADAERDAATALAAGRPVCYSLNGYARYFPGVERNEDRLFCEGVEKNFRGTSDVVVGDSHLRLIDQAREYAVTYNRYTISNRSSAK